MVTEGKYQGGILSHDKICARLAAGDIFRDGTYDLSRVKAASYDLRIANDLLFIARPGGRQLKYPIGSQRYDSVILEPGDTALFSTKEKCCFPFDLGTYISTKWGLARQGILVLTGGFVNPGFGLRHDAKGWVAEEDERLHFFVVNVGDRPRSFTRDDAIASLTFVKIDGTAPAHPADSTQRLIAESYDEEGALVGLGFLTDVAEQRGRLRALDSRVGDIEKGLQPLISFGVYLVAAALLGVVATISIGFLGSAPISDALRSSSTSNWPGLALVSVYVVGALVALKLLLTFIQRVFQAASRVLSRPRKARSRVLKEERRVRFGSGSRR